MPGALSNLPHVVNGSFAATSFQGYNGQMKLPYVLIGGVMVVAGAFAAIDLLTHTGFSCIETPRLGPWGFLGPAVMLIGLVFLKYQGRPFSRPWVGWIVLTGGIFQTLGMIPFIQPRILAPTAGHAGMGLNEIISAFSILCGLGAFVVTTVVVMVDRPPARVTRRSR